MIKKIDAIPILIEACPSFEGVWQEHLADFGNDVLHIAAGKFAHHLLELFKSGDYGTFEGVGAAIERLLVEGSPPVRDLAVVGVLEGIQNSWSNNQTDPENFFPFLGATGGSAWIELNRSLVS